MQDGYHWQSDIISLLIKASIHHFNVVCIKKSKIELLDLVVMKFFSCDQRGDGSNGVE